MPTRNTIKSATDSQTTPYLAAIFYLPDLSWATEVCLYKLEKSVHLVP